MFFVSYFSVCVLYTESLTYNHGTYRFLTLSDAEEIHIQ